MVKCGLPLVSKASLGGTPILHGLTALSGLLSITSDPYGVPLALSGHCGAGMKTSPFSLVEKLILNDLFKKTLNVHNDRINNMIPSLLIFRVFLNKSFRTAFSHSVYGITQFPLEF